MMNMIELYSKSNRIGVNNKSKQLLAMDSLNQVMCDMVFDIENNCQ